MMSKGKAMAIFLQLDSDDFDDVEKVLAIYLVMNMATHNSIKKADMLNALKWLWHSAYEIDEKALDSAGLPDDVKQALLDSFMKGADK